ncbi:DUF4352 domain-containing protein [Streptomonospora nanhaiensis]|uniref:DUF4352 domain-containing protein n=1 Tax=Streptomonospora nanhaiensis TaxID=1323731 RepID=A0ABY6YGW6_9ACTN|nr:DUF4352 domain-containing protein [Streptomonospora nanhaiensis]WAE71498.1 DUF4352 domain-containing protein [Streptomonospora nanhaiensis]
MTGREPEDGAGEASEPRPDPVNHHPPEEWRPGDPGDPVEGGRQPPGEPPHEFPHHDPHMRQPPPGGEGEGYTSQDPPPGGLPGRDRPFGAHPYREQPYGDHPQEDGAPGETPAGGSSAPGAGELSEGPNGPAQAGYEHEGYPPGYGETDTSEAGAGGAPDGGPLPGDRSSGQGPGYGEAGGYPSGQGPGFASDSGYAAHHDPGQGYGQGPGYGPGQPPGYGPPGYGQGPAYGQGWQPQPGYTYPPQGGYGPPETRPTPWGKIIGIGCGVLLLLLLLGGGCTAIALISAGVGDRATEGSGERAPGDEGLTETRGAEVTAGETDFEPSPLYAEGVYTSVAVSVTNSGEEQLDVNPLYFSIVDEEGSVHSTSEAIGMDANELGAQTLAPGQTTSGAITVEGRVDAARVVFEPFYSGPVEAPVT